MRKCATCKHAQWEPGFTVKADFNRPYSGRCLVSHASILAADGHQCLKWSSYPGLQIEMSGQFGVMASITQTKPELRNMTTYGRVADITIDKHEGESFCLGVFVPSCDIHWEHFTAATTV